MSNVTEYAQRLQDLLGDVAQEVAVATNFIQRGTNTIAAIGGKKRSVTNDDLTA